MAKIAIIGIGGVFPDAPTAKKFWQNILAGHVAIREVPKDRWDPELFWSSDRAAPDKTYSRIGAFLRDIQFDAKRFRIPPATLQAIDTIQRLGLMAVAEALEDANLEVFPGSGQGRSFARDRMAAIIGNAMGGEQEDKTSMRAWYPLFEKAFLSSSAAKLLTAEQVRQALTEIEAKYKSTLPTITEDSMAGELSNCITGRIANAFDFNGPNFTTDAACASSMAALQAAVHGLRSGQFDIAIAGGADQMMDPPAFAKFSKIGALSAEMSAPFDKRANGFVMGEGVGALVLKRLEDAERDGDRIYAVVRGVGGSSDGKGKGMMAPNPKGQRLAIERAYADAGLGIDTIGLFEAHGTATVVGDSTEVQVITELLRATGQPPRGVPIGSVKSMIGHLKAAAGVASLIKVACALRDKTLPPSANFIEPPQGSPLHEGYLAVNTKARPWQSDAVRRAGVSSFGFGGINFHAVLEEYLPAGAPALHAGGSTAAYVATTSGTGTQAQGASAPRSESMNMNVETLVMEIQKLFAEKTGYELADLDPTYQLEADLGIDTVKQAEIMGILRERYGFARDDKFRLADTPTLQKIAVYIAARVGSAQAAAPAQPAVDVTATPTPSASETPRDEGAAQTPWRVVVFGAETLVAAGELAQRELATESAWPPACATHNNRYAAAKVRVAFAAQSLDEARKKAADIGKRKARVLAAQGIFVSEAEPLAKAGKVAFVFPGQGSQFLGMFKDLAALYPVVADTFAEADRILTPLIGKKLTDIAWAQASSDEEIAAAELALRQTEICQPAMLTADVAMFRLLGQHGLSPTMVAGHSLGEYAACVAGGVMSFADALYAVSARGREMAGVKVKDNGKMASISAGVDKVEPVLREIDGYVIAANKNCFSQTVIAGETLAVEKAVAKFTALGIEAREIPVSHAFHSAIVAPASTPLRRVLDNLTITAPTIPVLCNVDASYYPSDKAKIVDLLGRQLESPVEFIAQIERLFADGARIFVEVGPRRAVTGFVRNVLDAREGAAYQAIATNHHKKPAVDTLMEALAALACEGISVGEPAPTRASSSRAVVTEARDEGHSGRAASGSTEQAGGQLADSARPVVSGVSAVLPSERPIEAIDGDVFARMLSGENFIQRIDEAGRRAMLAKNVTRLDKEGGEFAPMRELAEVVQLAACIGEIDVVRDYGVDAGFDDALDRTSRLAIAAGIDALRDAGLPLVRRYRTTSTGKQLPDRWALPADLGKRTGIIFASAFPGVDRLIDDVSQHIAAKKAGEHAAYLKELGAQLAKSHPQAAAALEATLRDRVQALDSEAALYRFNRKFLFRVLAMGHAQLAQHILAQGPNTQVNAACASGTQGIAIATDWIAAGRCDRVVVVTADDVTQQRMLPWFGAGFLSAGAASVDHVVERAAVPFGTHRNGMILGAGAAAFVVERDQDVTARGMVPLVDVIATRFVNSAFHGTRLDGGFICNAFSEVIEQTSALEGLSREQLAAQAFFMSHETYTPARGGSSAAEIDAIRFAFGEAAPSLLIANTKGYTGHPMGASLEDVVAIKALQRGVMPAIANLNDIDPAFVGLNFARGGEIDARYAIHFAAGFGSQVAMAVFRRRAEQEARVVDGERYHAWLAQMAGRGDAGLEVVSRTLRVAEKGGVKAWELGVPSLARAVATGPAVVAPQATQTDESAAVPARRDRAALMAELRALFAERTGYDVADLEPAHQLEADLGIDTVKQAEILSTIRERYALGKDDNFKLAQVPTLDAVVDYVMSRLGASSSGALDAASMTAAGDVSRPTEAPTSAAPTATAPTAPTIDRTRLVEELRALFAERTGYDVADLDPSFQLEADLGIDTVKQAEIFSTIRERYALGKDESFKLAQVQTLDAVVDYVMGRMRTDGGAPTLAPTAPLVVQAAPEAAVAASTETDQALPGAPVGPNRGTLMSELRALFAERTGYELADLDPSFQLEADLGIDTVKQAEIFSVIRERYGLKKDESFKLASVSTLNAVVDYVESRLAMQGSGGAPAKASKAKVAPAKGPTPIPESWHEGDSITVRSVSAVELGAPGAPTRSLAGRHVVLAGNDEVFRLALREALLAQGANVHVINLEALSNEALEARLANVGGQPADDVVYFVAEHGSINVGAVEADVARAFRLARAFARARGTMDGAGLAFVGRSTGIFGQRSQGDVTGLVMGALSGIAKSLAKEWPKARCLALDLDRLESLPGAAERLLAEWTSSGPTEIAYHGAKRWTLRQVERVSGAAAGLAPRSSVVVTGGARGVTFEILRELATRAPLRIAILARTGGLTPGETPITRRSDAEQKELARAALTAASERVTPAAVRRWIDHEKTRVSVSENMEALRRMGCDVELVLCDVGDLGKLHAACERVRRHLGGVDLLLHGAGREESKFLAEKDAEAFERIFAPKARAGLSAWLALKPRRTLVMGSVAGRFGNAGQADYAAANELLAAFARAEERDVLCVDWTAWDDVGMATRESVRHVLDSSGVEFLPAQLGARIGAMLATAPTRGDVVVAGELGVFAPVEFPEVTAALAAARGEAPPAGVFDRVEPAAGVVTYIRRLDVSRDVGLDHHRIDGTAVLPGVVGVEMMTQAAAQAAGRSVARLEDVHFDSPVKLHRDEPLDARVEARAEGEIVRLQLVTEFVGPSGKRIRREHFRAKAVLGERASLQRPAMPRLEMPREPGITRADVYRRYFHGPVFQVLGAINTMGEDGLEAQTHAPWPRWIDGVEHAALVSAPFVREAGFQAAGLWEMAEIGRMALPASVERIELAPSVPADARLIVEARLVQATPQGSVFDVWTRDAEGNVYDVMRGYRTVTLRNLEDHERFEPGRRTRPTPNYLVVELAEVEQTLASDPDATLERYLSPSERQRFKELRTAKRRVDWLAGRIAAKRLIREARFAREGAIVPYGAITILPDDLGAPQVKVVGEERSQAAVSITHSAGVAAAMLTDEPGMQPGIDVERIETRDPSFERDYFTDAERELVRQSTDKDTMLTSIWAVKEAVVKALGIGARVDLREIEVTRSGEAWSVAMRGEALQRAQTLRAEAPTVDVEVLKQRVVARVLMQTGERMTSKKKAEASA